LKTIKCNKYYSNLKRSGLNWFYMTWATETSIGGMQKGGLSGEGVAETKQKMAQKYSPSQPSVREAQIGSRDQHVLQIK
jgi:hypothetical protein